MTFSTTYPLLWLQFPVMDCFCKILGSTDTANWVLYPCHMRHGILLGHNCMRVLNNWIWPGHNSDTAETRLGPASWKKKWLTNPAHHRSSFSSSLQMFLFFFITDLFFFVFVFFFFSHRKDWRTDPFIFPPCALFFCSCVLSQLLFKIVFYEFTFYYSFIII